MKNDWEGQDTEGVSTSCFDYRHNPALLSQAVGVNNKKWNESELFITPRYNHYDFDEYNYNPEAAIPEYNPEQKEMINWLDELLKSEPKKELIPGTNEWFDYNATIACLIKIKRKYIKIIDKQKGNKVK